MVDIDQTAFSEETIWSGPAQIVQAFLAGRCLKFTNFYSSNISENSLKWNRTVISLISVNK